MNQALDTLGNTKWRVNKRILSVIERIWSNGGCLAGLVDLEDVGTVQLAQIIFVLIFFHVPFSF